MLKESTPCQLKIGKQSVLLSKLLNAEINSTMTIVNNKISKFLHILAADILCMREDTTTICITHLSNTEFSIQLKHSYPFFSFFNDIYSYHRSDEACPNGFYIISKSKIRY